MSDWSRWFVYDPDSPTGLLIKEERYGGKDGKSPVVYVGDVAGCVSSDGYGKVSLFSKIYCTHRIIWEMFNGSIPQGFQVDHLDGNRTNNSIRNLRLVCSTQNAMNRWMSSANKSGVTGVRYYEKTVKGITYAYWRAFWKPVDKKSACKDFSVAKLGFNVAFDLACKAREEAICNLKANGADYTERHGVTLNENFNLARMLRKVDEGTIKVKDVLDKLKIEY